MCNGPHPDAGPIAISLYGCLSFRGVHDSNPVHRAVKANTSYMTMTLHI